MNKNSVIEESIDKVIEHLEEEARMVLPGIQALFGFQLIAVFNQRFAELSELTQALHFMAILLSATAMLFVMVPAAYHRQVEPHQVSERLCKIGTVCLTICLLPLSVGIAIDVFVIGELLKYSDVISFIFAGGTFSALFIAWFLFPQIMRRVR